MRINNADSISDWVIELRDGALAIQRAFAFESHTQRSLFMKRMGDFMKSPGMNVIADPSTLEPGVAVSIQFLPESHLLKAAGKIAATFEYEFDLIAKMPKASAA